MPVERTITAGKTFWTNAHTQIETLRQMTINWLAKVRLTGTEAK
jgi:hypothetical protein